jgi:hypothetical protein
MMPSIAAIAERFCISIASDVTRKEMPHNQEDIVRASRGLAMDLPYMNAVNGAEQAKYLQ